MENESREAIWNLILQVRSVLRNRIQPTRYLCIMSPGHAPAIHFDSLPDDGTDSVIIDFEGGNSLGDAHLVAKAPFCLEVEENRIFDSAQVDFLSLYLPYALLPHFSLMHEKCYAISHFAQTLDGRIASSTGNSQWIGNQENLEHAHRMRALCDGILIGRQTLENDDPSLNVRLVKGDDPTKIIIARDARGIETFKAVDEDTIVFCQDQPDHDNAEQRIGLAMRDGKFVLSDLLDILGRRGLDSVYIEGGSFTTSAFLKQGSIDQLQVHISPIVVGSGLTGFGFDGLDSIKQAIGFGSYRFIPIGDHVMFIGEMVGKNAAKV